MALEILSVDCIAIPNIKNESHPEAYPSGRFWWNKYHISCPAKFHVVFCCLRNGYFNGLRRAGGFPHENERDLTDRHTDQNTDHERYQNSSGNTIGREHLILLEDKLQVMHYVINRRIKAE